MSEAEVRYYAGWTIAPQNEVTEAVARGRRNYARAIFGAHGAPRVAEMYSDGRLARVEFSESADTIPGVPFAVRRPGGSAGDFHWSVIWLYTAEGTLRNIVIQLLDGAERSWMSVEYSPAGDLVETSKASFDTTGNVHYVFSYDESGEPYEVYDSPQGRSPGIEDALDEVSDRAFYADGRALPPNVSPVPDNDPDEIARRELGRPEPVRSGRDDEGLP